MKWAVTFLLLGAWTILAWLADNFIDWAGDAAAVASGQVISHQDSLTWLTWAAGLAESAGRIAVLGVWIAGCLLLLAVPVLLRRLAKRGAGSPKIPYFRRKGE